MKRLCLQSDPSWTGERIDKFLAEVMKPLFFTETI